MIAQYRRKADAERYAREIMQRWPDARAWVSDNLGFYWGVMVERHGKTAPATKRPHGFATRKEQVR